LGLLESSRVAVGNRAAGSGHRAVSRDACES